MPRIGVLMKPNTAAKWTLLIAMFFVPFVMGAGCDASCRAKDDTGVTTEVHRAVDDAAKGNKDVKIKIETKRD